MAPSEGTAIAIGLLPTTRSAPPGAGIRGRVLHMAMPMQSLLGRLLGVAPRGAEMKAVADCDNADAMLFGPRHRNVDRLGACELAESVSGIKHDGASSVRDDRRRFRA